MVVGDGLFLSLNNHSHNSASFHSTASVKFFKHKLFESFVAFILEDTFKDIIEVHF
jgi:hypothetical protein